MAGHTPGPWLTEGGLIKDAQREILATVHGAGFYPDDPGKEVGNVNARLMAAAPDLLAALKRLESRIGWCDSRQRWLIEDGSPRDFLTVDAIREARAAIAKAEGKQ